MPTYSDASKITALEVCDRTTLNGLTDGSDVPLRNVMCAYTITDLAGLIAPAIQIKILLAAAPASSGTKFAKYAMGSTACDMSTGKWYTKTSEVGATDGWSLMGTEPET
jgi:hypothetical protein